MIILNPLAFKSGDQYTSSRRMLLIQLIILAYQIEDSNLYMLEIMVDNFDD